MCQFVFRDAVFGSYSVWLRFANSLQCDGMDLMGLKPNPLELSSFSALTLLVESFDP